MKIINLQDLCENLNRIISELKNMDNYHNNNMLNQNNNKVNNKKNLTEFINNISKNNLGTGFHCNNNEYIIYFFELFLNLLGFLFLI